MKSFALFIATLAALLCASPANAGPGLRRAGPAAHQPAKKKPTGKINYEIAVQIVRTADDDGGSASTLTKTKANKAIARMNEIWSRNGGDVRFRLHAASNFDHLIKNTVLNQDCRLKNGHTAKSIAKLTNPDLNGDGKDATIEDIDVFCDMSSTKSARTAYAMQRADRIIVWSRGGDNRVRYQKGHWVLDHPGGGASSANGSFVIMPKNFGKSLNLLAHEVGHYMHAAHTFGPQPSSLKAARDAIQAWAAKHPGKDLALTFDGDAAVQYAVHDTAPDPGERLWKSVYGDKCAPSATSVTVHVTIDGKSKSVTLTPDRRNIMSYFMDCPLHQHLSAGQFEQVHLALSSGNRKALVETSGGSCYSSGSHPGNVADSKSKLTMALRKLASCILLQKKPMPWETVTQDIYVNPADAVMQRGFRRVGRLGVHVARERALVETMLDVTMVQ